VHKNIAKTPPSQSKLSTNMVIGALGVGAVLAIAVAQRRRGQHHTYIPREVAATFAERTALVQGIQMRWLEHGQGCPVVLVHGIPTSPELWRRVMPRLRGAQALAWEMVGYGKSIPG
jgi:hypothetical protein